MIRQLLDIFVPEQLNGNYILSTTTLSVIIEQDAVIGTVVALNNRSITVKKVFTETLGDSNDSQQAKIAAAIKRLNKKVGSYHKIITCLPSSLVTFKELTFPFEDIDKIHMVLRYEVESLLPFSVHEAAIDFLVTNVDSEKKHTHVMVTAVQKKFIEEHLKPFYDAGVEVSDVSVDIIGLYGLYLRQLPAEQLGNAALISFDADASKVLFFTNGQLASVRTIRESFPNTNNKELWNKINFTLQSFADENAEDQKIKKIVLVGISDKQKLEEANAEIAFPCEAFSLQKFATQTNIKIKPELTTINLNGLVTALPLPDGRYFTLEANHITQQEQGRLNRQTIAALLFSFGALALLAGHTFTQIRKLSVELEESQKQIVQTLKKEFPTIKTNSQRDALDLADREVKRQKSVWSSLSAQTRQSFLQYLYDLSIKIDRETLGLNLKKMVINKKTITLEGNVRSFDAVEQFEQQLRETKLFVAVPDMQKIDFSVQLPLDTQGAS